MKTKNTLLSIAIIAALPFSAMADYTYNLVDTPAIVANNGTVNVAATGGPYQIADIGEHDDEHIATTAYVKGAYNDTIRAVNKILVDWDGMVEDIYADKQDALFFVVDDEATQSISNEVAVVLNDTIEPNQLVTGDAIMNFVDTKRVTIYTTWGNDTAAATTKVALSNQ